MLVRGLAHAIMRLQGEHWVIMVLVEVGKEHPICTRQANAYAVVDGYS
jgi:hypothetical protein